jgi:hypothetical protein
MADQEKQQFEEKHKNKKDDKSTNKILKGIFLLSQISGVVAFIFLILFVLETKVKIPYSFIIFTFIGRLGLFLNEYYNGDALKNKFAAVCDFLQVIGYLVLLYITSTIKNGVSALNKPVKNWVNKCLI